MLANLIWGAGGVIYPTESRLAPRSRPLNRMEAVEPKPRGRRAVNSVSGRYPANNVVQGRRIANSEPDHVQAPEHLQRSDAISSPWIVISPQRTPP